MYLLRKRVRDNLPSGVNMSPKEKIVISFVRDMLSNPINLEHMLSRQIAESYYGYNQTISGMYHPAFRNRVTRLQKAILATMAGSLYVGLDSEESKEDMRDLCARFHREDMTGIPVFKEFVDEE